MSRSYKKNPFVTEGYGGDRKQKKQMANRRFRRKISSDEDMPPRPQYRKYTCTYDICDYKWRETYREAINWYEYEASESFKKLYPTLESYLNYWEKCYKRK